MSKNKKSLKKNHKIRFSNLLLILTTFVKKNYLLVGITIFAILLRLLGTNPGYPQIHSDEPSLQEATRILVLYRNYDPQNYYYGSLLPIIYATGIIFFFIPVFFIQLSITQNHIYGERGVFGFIDYFFQKLILGGQYFDTFFNIFPYWTRYETAIVSGATTIVIYLIGKNLFGKKVGLIAAFLTAISYRHVLSSVFTLADAPAAFFAGLSIYLSIKLLKKPTMRKYLLAGIGLGMTLSVKYFVYAIPTFFLCHIFSVWAYKKSSFINKVKNIILSRYVLLSITICTLVFLLINPYLFLNKKEADRQLQYNAQRYQLDKESVLHKLTPPFSNLPYEKAVYPIVYLFHYGFGEIMFIFILLSYTYALIRYFKQTFIISSALLPYLFVFILLSGNAPVRNFAVITPFLMLFPALLIFDLTKIIQSQKLQTLAILLLVFVIGYQNLKNSYLTILYYSKPLNYVKIRAWLEDNVPVNAVIAKTGRVFVQKEHIGIRINGLNGDNLSVSELQSKNAQWAIINSDESTLANMLFLIGNSQTNNLLLNQQKENLFLNNTYTSLAIQELGYYRVAEFVKPYWQSLEPALFVSKIPPVITTDTGSEIFSTKFDSDGERKQLNINSLLGIKQPENIHFTREGIDNSYALYVKNCADQTQITIKEFSDLPNRYFVLFAVGKRTFNKSLEREKTGFLRLDFFTKDGNLIKTYVSPLLAATESWQELQASGLSPQNTSYGKISIQFDKCFDKEQYFFDDIFLNVESNISKNDFKDYQFFEKKLPYNFIWLPEMI